MKYIIEHIFEISAFLVSLIAILISIRSNTISKKAYLLSQKEFKNKQSKFKLYLIDSHSFSKEKFKYLLFQLTITNLSEIKNSFKIHLEIEYTKTDNSISKIKLDYSPEIASVLTENTFSFFDKNVSISEKENISNWLIFRTPLEFIEINKIESYIVCFTDVEDNRENVSSVLINELRYEI